MDDAALGAMDAVETARRVRARELSPAEVIESAIRRARAASHLGAVVTETFERALQRVHAGAPAGPLAGVPTFVKDLSHLAGVPTGWGSLGAGGYVPRRSDPFVRRLERAGLVFLGKSATPELGLTGTTEPVGRAPCRNPWDPSRSIGGSSGGAACLVAAGVVPIAHASDGGGSIRIPAACAGLVGLKPTRGVADMPGSNLLPVNIAVEGVVSRTVRDQVAFWDALGLPAGARRSGPLRVGVFTDAPAGTPVAAEVRDAVTATGALCASLGHRVEAIAAPFEAQPVADFLAYWGFVAWVQVKTARLMMSRRFDTTRFEPWTLGMVDTFARAPRAVLQATRRLRAFARTYDTVMQSYDVLVSMVTADVPPPLGYLAPDLEFSMGYERIRSWLPVTGLWNAAGAPAISLPLGRSRGGLPIGVQLGAARGGDRLLLELAAALEEARPWPRVAPRERWQPDAGGRPTPARGD